MLYQGNIMCSVLDWWGNEEGQGEKGKGGQGKHQGGDRKLPVAMQQLKQQ